jgi:N-formylglutamate deformylase
VNSTASGPEHGYVLLWDAHSIRSKIPWLFEGKLPDLNIGTADGASADPAITHAVANAAARCANVTHVVNGRFKGGYITRHYGDPQRQVHALQLEMCQSLYMGEDAAVRLRRTLAQGVQPVLKDMLAAALASCEAIHVR